MGKKHQAAPKKGDKKAAKRGDSKGDEEGAAAAGERRQKGSKKEQRRRIKGSNYTGDDLERELAPLGLRVKLIEADGNCFFRSVCDQLEGEGGDHQALRQRVMAYIEERAEEYRFFIEDDEPFDKYVKRMKKDGAWAGHLELQATSVLLQRNISVYHAGQPVWHIRNCAEDTPTLHLSYHDGMHYNSVRNRDDHGAGPPEPLRVGSAAELAGADVASSSAVDRSFGTSEINQVVAGTGSNDRERVARVLEQCGGSVEQAIEMLIEQLGQEEVEEEEEAVGCQGAAEAGVAGQGAAAPPQGVEAADSTEQQKEQQQQEQLRDCAILASSGAGQQQQATAAIAAGGAEGQQPQQQEEQQKEQQRPWGSDCIKLGLLPDPSNSGCIRLHLQLPSAQQTAQQHAAVAEAGATEPAAAAEAQSDGRPAVVGKGKKGVKVKKAVSHVGRNTRCPCGSTRRYKNCCGAAKGERRAKGEGPTLAAAADGGSTAATAAQQLQMLFI